MPHLLRAHGLRLLAYSLAFVAIGLAGWIDRTFGQPSIDQILYHLVYAEGAAVEMGRIFIFTFVAEVLAFPLAFAVAATVLHGMVARRWPALRNHVLRAPAPLAMGTGVVLLLAQFSAFSYAAAQFGPDRFAERYVDPASVKIEFAGPRRNLILIYVESLETTYGDAALFGRDLLAPLRSVGGRAIAPLKQAQGANWTIAGMVSTQCGVPLKVYSEQDVRHVPGQRSFLPGATCLGDVLAARGWHNVFLGGAPLSFSGKGTFLRDHGYAEVYGRDEWEKLGVQKSELNVWGLYDSALFERARTKLAALHASGQPFNLTLLTLDTHNPFGFLSPHCLQGGARDFPGIVGCASTQIADFIRFARQKGYLEDTTVFVMGDHLAVPNPVYEQLQRAPERRVFNLVVAPELPPVRAREITHFDLYPTFLELAGLRAQGGRVGLGVSAFAQVRGNGGGDPLPLAALAGSQAYHHLWEPPQP